MKTSPTSSKSRIHRGVLLAALLGWAGTMVLIFSLASSGSGKKGLFCDAEKVVLEDGKAFFEGKSGRFLNGQTQSDEFAHSGRYSSKVWLLNEYGMAHHLHGVKGGEIYEIEVWRKCGGSFGDLVIEGDWNYRQALTTSGAADPGGWELLKLTVTVPPWVDDGILKVFCFNNREVPAFFDDLSIRRVPHSKKYSFPSFDKEEVQTIPLDVDPAAMEQLKAKQQEALRTGVLHTGNKDWVPVSFLSGDKKYKGRMRLKGDWTDHLIGEKWSFRIELQDSSTWKRMPEFSLHNPATRHYLDEWVFHQWLQAEGVLTTQYGFVHLNLNGKSLGLYAYEEHFGKELLERQHRREGPIIRFNEEGYWQLETDQIPNGVNAAERIPLAESAPIDGFHMKQTLSDSLLRQQFLVAQSLLQQFRSGSRSPAQIFDLEKMAAFFAILDLTQAHHAIIWHNLRFYFNPVTQLLEPIGFDGYTEEGGYNWIKRPFIAHARHIEFLSADFRERIFEPLLLDRKFLEIYLAKLERFTTKEYLTDLLLQLKPGATQASTWLAREFDNYYWNPAPFFTAAGEIRQALHAPKQTAATAWTVSREGKTKTVHVENFHCVPLIARLPDGSDQLIPAFSGQLPADFVRLSLPADAKKLKLIVPGGIDTLSIDILSWPPPLPQTAAQEVWSQAKPESNALFTVNEGTIIFATGAHRVMQPIVIPAGYTVVMQQGTELDFVNSSYFLCRSPLIIKGTEEEKVRITSSDHSARGFTIIQPNGACLLHHAEFSDFGTLNLPGWTLTGAVTFYEAEVKLMHCAFTASHCEDALNLIRCIFTMESCRVAQTSGDGFDADFCTGTILSSQFMHTTNDGLDMSGSKITVNACTFHHNGDKGVSVGEESSASLNDIFIYESVTGIASKDLSRAEANRITMNAVKTGFALYQKKPEYGPAQMKVLQYKGDKVNALHSVATGCTLELNGEVIGGK